MYHRDLHITLLKLSKLCKYHYDVAVDHERHPSQFDTYEYLIQFEKTFDEISMILEVIKRSIGSERDVDERDLLDNILPNSRRILNANAELF